MFRLGNVDLDKMVDFFEANPEEYARSMDAMRRFYKDTGILIVDHYGDKLKKTVHGAIEEGRYSGQWGSFFDMHAFKMSGFRDTRSLAVNTGMIKLPEFDNKRLSDILREGRKMSHHVAAFLKKNLPGCENSFIVSTSNALGIRRTRWLKGEYTLTPEEYGKIFTDSVGRGVTIKRWGAGSETFDVPLRCMLPPNVEGLIIGSGRSTASNPAELLRIQPVTMIVGQGAGVAAAVSVQAGTAVRDVDTADVRRVLQKQGVILE